MRRMGVGVWYVCLRVSGTNCRVHARVLVRVHACACVRARVGSRVYVCVCARARVCACVCVRVHAYARSGTEAGVLLDDALVLDVVAHHSAPDLSLEGFELRRAAAKQSGMSIEDLSLKRARHRGMREGDAGDA